jgi:hypothetical protein
MGNQARSKRAKRKTQCHESYKRLIMHGFLMRQNNPHQQCRVFRQRGYCMGSSSEALLLRVNHW